MKGESLLEWGNRIDKMFIRLQKAQEDYMSVVDMWDSERLAKFWEFVCERQKIYWARTYQYKRPWTKDPILANHFFCNVYRELDRGTQFVLNYIYKDKGWSTSGKQLPSSYPDIIFRILIYRMFNEPRTYMFIEHMLLQPYHYNGREAADILDRKHEAGIRVFRSAWMTSGANIKGSKARAYCMEMNRVYKNRLDLANSLMNTSTMEHAWEIICGLKWFGGFSAYQVVLDLSYLPAFKNRWTDYDTWVYPGPGARLGLMWICGKSPTKRFGFGAKKFLPDLVCRKMIYRLRDKQDHYFKKFHLNFKRWDKKPLDLHNIEFALCEYNKYMRAHYGGKKKKFVPNDEQLRLSL